MREKSDILDLVVDLEDENTVDKIVIKNLSVGLFDLHCRPMPLRPNEYLMTINRNEITWEVLIQYLKLVNYNNNNIESILYHNQIKKVSIEEIGDTIKFKSLNIMNKEYFENSLNESRKVWIVGLITNPTHKSPDEVSRKVDLKINQLKDLGWNCFYKKNHQLSKDEKWVLLFIYEI